MIGIYDCFGYGAGYDVSFEERYKLIKNAGFDSVMLWWSDKFGRGEGYQNDVKYARNAGLFVENIHAPVYLENCLSHDDLDGEDTLFSYIQCVADCYNNSIPTMVVHLPGDTFPINSLGMKRLNTIITEAENKKIQIAFENLNNIKNVTSVLDSFRSEYVGFCYDSCHHENYASGIDLLNMFGHRLMILHLHDNKGKRNQHQLPFDGNIDWTDVMHRISMIGYKGSTTLEPMNWDYEDLSIKEFLLSAYQKAQKLDKMRV